MGLIGPLEQCPPPLELAFQVNCLLRLRMRKYAGEKALKRTATEVPMLPMAAEEFLHPQKNWFRQ
jgi:hypothetical protein